MSEKVFIVVCRDRHVDLGLSVHRTRESADTAIESFMDVYADDRISWVERNYGAPKWARFVETEHDDGPSAYIEISTLQ